MTLLGMACFSANAPQGPKEGQQPPHVAASMTEISTECLFFFTFATKQVGQAYAMRFRCDTNNDLEFSNLNQENVGNLMGALKKIYVSGSNKEEVVFGKGSGLSKRGEDKAFHTLEDAKLHFYTEDADGQRLQMTIKRKKGNAFKLSFVRSNLSAGESRLLLPAVVQKAHRALVARDDRKLLKNKGKTLEDEMGSMIMPSFFAIRKSAHIYPTTPKNYYSGAAVAKHVFDDKWFVLQLHYPKPSDKGETLETLVLGRKNVDVTKTADRSLFTLLRTHLMSTLMICGLLMGLLGAVYYLFLMDHGTAAPPPPHSGPKASAAWF